MWRVCIQSSLSPICKVKVCSTPSFGEQFCRQMMRRIQKLLGNLIRSVSWFFLYPLHKPKTFISVFHLLHNHSLTVIWVLWSWRGGGWWIWFIWSFRKRVLVLRSHNLWTIQHVTKLLFSCSLTLHFHCQTGRTILCSSTETPILGDRWFFGCCSVQIF